MSIFDFFRAKQSQRRRTKPTPRPMRPLIEQLELRDVPTTDIFTVAGTANSQVTLNFEWKSRSSTYWDEIGVFKVADDAGRVGDLLPGDTGYTAAALDIDDTGGVTPNSQTVFAAGDFEGAKTSQTFTAGTKLAFYLVQNNTLENAEAVNPNNLAREGKQAFVSVDEVNTDNFDHMKVTTFADGSIEIRFEDATGGGDKDFNDAVIKITYASLDGAKVAGVTGQTVSMHFTHESSISPGFATAEFGVFVVDDITGKIGALSPGESGYAKAALQSATRQTIFKQSDPVGATKDITLPGGAFYGYYLIPGSNSATFLSKNPKNKATVFPQVFFTFQSANPDGLDHVHWLSNTKVAFEDKIKNGDKDFNDYVVTFTAAVPTNTAASVKAPIANINTTVTASNRVIDLAGVFDDVDLGNSKIRLNTNFGPINVVLYDRLAPKTVANFYDYILGFESFATATAADEKITVSSIPFVVGDQVKFAQNQSDALPAGITAGTTYFVTSVSGTSSNVITVSTTTGGSNVDITADGNAIITKLNAYNSNVFHRSADAGNPLSDFVLQGGTWKFSDNAADPNSLDAIINDTTPLLDNEPDPTNRPDVRGTLAMAKGSSPNGASSGFFINLDNNTTGGNVNLDDTSRPEGAFSVFGRIADSASLQRIDQVAAPVTQDHGSPFNEIPLKNYNQASVKASNDTVTTTGPTQFIVGDQVTIVAGTGKTLPAGTGITAGHTYFVKSAVANGNGQDLTLSENLGDPAVNVTADFNAFIETVPDDAFVKTPPTSQHVVTDATTDNLFVINSVTVVSRSESLRYTASSSDPTKVAVIVTNERLTLDFLATTTSPVTVTVNAIDQGGTVTGTATTDKIAAAGLALKVGDKVTFTAGTGQTLPGGVTEGTIYIVKTVASNGDVTLKTTASNTTVDITSDGTATLHHVTTTTFTVTLT